MVTAALRLCRLPPTDNHSIVEVIAPYTWSGTIHRVVKKKLNWMAIFFQISFG